MKILYLFFSALALVISRGSVTPASAHYADPCELARYSQKKHCAKKIHPSCQSIDQSFYGWCIWSWTEKRVDPMPLLWGVPPEASHKTLSGLPYIHPEVSELACRDNTYKVHQKYIRDNFSSAHSNAVGVEVRYGTTTKTQDAVINYRSKCVNAQCSFNPRAPKGKGWSRLGILESNEHSCQDTYGRLLSNKPDRIEVELVTSSRIGDQADSRSYSESIFVKCSSWEYMPDFADSWKPMSSKSIFYDLAAKHCR